MKILLAEDNPINQKVAARLLEKWGHKVAAAGNGREALEAMDRVHFDLAVMDVDMPVMDGLQAVRELREKEKTTGAHLPVIALTAHAMKGDKERCLAAGMDAYVPKPVQVKELYDAIEQLTAGCKPDIPARCAPAAHGTVFDRARALEYVSGSEELLAEIAAVFLEHAPKILAEAHMAIASRDPKMLERAAHTLKGSVSMFGAEAAREAAQELECLGRAGTVDGADAMYATLEGEVARLCAALAEISDSARA